MKKILKAEGEGCKFFKEDDEYSKKADS